MDVGTAGGVGRDVRVAIEPSEELFHQAEVDVMGERKVVAEEDVD